MSKAVEFYGNVDVRLMKTREVRERGRKVQLYMTIEPFTMVSPTYGPIHVPAGFVTDFASVPKVARFYTGNENPALGYGSLVHDYIYSVLGVLPDRVLNRQAADEVLREAMLACGARPSQAWVVYKAVRAGGGNHWKS